MPRRALSSRSTCALCVKSSAAHRCNWTTAHCCESDDSAARLSKDQKTEHMSESVEELLAPAAVPSLLEASQRLVEGSSLWVSPLWVSPIDSTLVERLLRRGGGTDSGVGSTEAESSASAVSTSTRRRSNKEAFGCVPEYASPSETITALVSP